MGFRARPKFDTGHRNGRELRESKATRGEGFLTQPAHGTGSLPTVELGSRRYTRAVHERGRYSLRGAPASRLLYALPVTHRAGLGAFAAHVTSEGRLRRNCAAQSWCARGQGTRSTSRPRRSRRRGRHEGRGPRRVSARAGRMRSEGGKDRGSRGRGGVAGVRLRGFGWRPAAAPPQENHRRCHHEDYEDDPADRTVPFGCG